MDRRDFLLGSGRGLGVAWVASLAGCRSGVVKCASDGFDPGPYEAGPEHLVFDAEGAAYVLDVEGHRVVALDEDGEERASFASLGDDAGELNSPMDAVVAPDGRLFVLDRGNGRVQVFDAEGAFQATIGGAGELHMPHDLVVHGERLYVCDTLQNRVVVWNLDGELQAVLGGGDDGLVPILNGPRGLAVADDGTLHVLDVGDATVEVLSADGAPLRHYGGYGADPGQMRAPRSIAILARRVYVADPSSGFVHVFELDGTFVGRFRPHDEDGACVAPVRVSVTPQGGLYIWTAGLGAAPLEEAEEEERVVVDS